MRRRLIMTTLALIVAGVVVVVTANAIVLLGGNGDLKQLRDVPHAQAALVLGAQVKPDGHPSAMLADRIAAADDLYRAHKVDKLLLSGDHGQWGYDEVGTMRRALLRDGVRPHSADRRGYGKVMARLRVREALARVKVVADALTGAGPHFLGTRIPIGSDGRRSWGPDTPRSRAAQQ